MTTTNRRIALLTGASLAALGVSVLTASPALAAPHDTLADGVYPGTGTTQDTIVICDLAIVGNPTVPGEPCFFGVIDRTGGPAIVNGTAAGELIQSDLGANVVLNMNNAAGSTAEVGAIAVGGTNVGAAITVPAILQVALASGDATANINNSGNLLIDAYASGSGLAEAAIKSGVAQAAFAGGTANVNLNNAAGGNLSVEAIAYASNTDGPAEAVALMGTEGTGQAGIHQIADGFAAHANIVNGGTIDVGALAQATGTQAGAIAFMKSGIHQSAHASGTYATTVGGSPVTLVGGDATVDLTNNGTINIHATASADAGPNLYGTGAASAISLMERGINQVAVASGGDAAVSLDNAGTINITALANANGDVAQNPGPFGGAFAAMGQGINQSATANPFVTGTFGESYNTAAVAGDASVSLTNRGTINIAALAYATADGKAEALASIKSGIHQSAEANSVVVGTGATATNFGGNATAYLTNAGAGVINIGAVANANGGAYGTTTEGIFGDASAAAFVKSGIDQEASADAGDALVTLSNAGAINILASAHAVAPRATVVSTGVLSSTHVAFPVANANASIKSGIHQSANAGGITEGYASVGAPGPYGTLVTTFTYHGADNASASLVNSGSINIGAEAVASAYDAHAGADVRYGIHQVANATAGTAAVANGTLINTGYGTIAIGAVASAYGSSHATANATIGTEGGAGIRQDINASVEDGTAVANAYLTNDGVISIGASAHASAGGPGVFGSTVAGNAEAHANVIYGIRQTASASGVGLATHTAGLRTAGGSYVTVDTYTGAGVAHAELNNTGAIQVSANAIANGGDANATVDITHGIAQLANALGGTAATANASMYNSADGSIRVVGNASASGSEGFAHADIKSGISQFAHAAVTAGDGPFGPANAVANLTNDGLITVGVHANAVGSTNDATAWANIHDSAIFQGASAEGTSGYATAAMVNNGTISIGANATALAASEGSAWASATIKSGIDQHAVAPSGATVSLTNSGRINLFAYASATAGEDATATAGIGTALRQSATATGTEGNASVSFTNSGSFYVTAAANATAGNDVFASAYANAIHQIANGGASGTANASFVNNGPLTVSAYATGLGGGEGTANAFASGIEQFAGGGGGATASVYNTDTIAVVANADVTVGNAAHRGSFAVASASANGVSQVANGGTASATTTGDPVFTADFGVNAYASQTLTGVAYTRTRTSETAPTGPALATLTNTGTIAVLANASAVGEPGALAFANAHAINQAAAGTSAAAFVYNSGTIAAYASAFASGQNGALATAHATGIRQGAMAAATNFRSTLYGTGTIHSTTEGLPGSIVYGTETLTLGTTTRVTGTFAAAPIGPAYATVTNTGLINVVANATALNALGGPAIGRTTTTPAFASAGALGIDQSARGTEAHLLVVNDGAIDVAANAYASGATAAAAVANAQGIVQHGNAMAETGTFTAQLGYATNLPGAGAGDQFPIGHLYQTLIFTTNATAVPAGAVYETVNNSGTIDVAATATAVAGSTAVANASATGVLQVASGSAVFQSVYNSGTMSAFANANASGTAAYASAFAMGVGQTASGTSVESLTLFNSGEINVGAAAVASGSYGTANATAFGYRATGNGGNAMTMDVVNAGTMNVNATAVAPDYATAHAAGMWVSNTAAGSVTGYITNSGQLNVVASASGGAGSYATATGIRTNSGINNLTITNSGSINVDAITANGGGVESYGIFVTGNGTTTPAAGDVVTINNSGDIIVRVSQDGGATFQRGDAIDVSEAPNRTVINLMGNGTAAANIYGDIQLQSDADTINSTNGETRFNGIVNSDLCGAFIGSLTLDDPAQNNCGVGTLNINSGGNFHLLNVAADGPSYVFMDTLNMGADGTITFDLPAPVGGGHDEPIGTYPQVFVNTANLDGTIVANIAAPANGLWDDTTYQNVIDATTRNGTFDNCIINGVPTGSLLIDATCIYDNANNVDIGIVRAAFNTPPGLNRNGEQVGEGLECIFDVSLTGGIANALADLMKISDPVNYNTALNMLSGSAYANYLQSFPSLGVHYNDLLDHATNCEIPALAGSVLECRASSPIHVWGQLDAQWRKADGDIEAGTTKSTRVTGLLGVDANVGNSAILGVSAGYVTNHTRDHQFGDHVNADGMQVGAYAVYDPGTFFVKGVTTYSWYDGDSSRHINFAGLGTGTAFTANPNGDPDVAMWTAGLHGGARFPMSGTSVITPYLNWDYVDAKLKSFIETGDNGVGLTVENAHSRHSFLTGGVKWATQMGGVVPEVNLGYRYRMGSSRSHFRAFFNGDADCDFEIISAAQKRGTFLAGVSVGGKMGPVDLRIGYEGEFNGDITSHSGNFKFVLPLGGHAAPPPPPPVVAPPPPPPPVEVAPPPPPPAPPPPPPVERGERGQ